MIDYTDIFGDDGAPNLDCGFDVEELLELSRTFKTLAKYAREKSTAIQYRLEGAIQGALDCEARCEKIYDELPKSARW